MFGESQAEVEGGEIVQPPGEEATEIQGPTHEQGGVNLSVPSGTLVYSDTLKGEDGKTMAERKKNRDSKLAKILAALEVDPSNVVTKGTLERYMKTYAVEEQGDLMMQEVARMLDEGIESDFFRLGGRVSPQKAKKILKDGKVHGKPLTDKQRRFFGAMSNYQLGTGPGGTDPYEKRRNWMVSPYSYLPVGPEQPDEFKEQPYEKKQVGMTSYPPVTPTPPPTAAAPQFDLTELLFGSNPPSAQQVAGATGQDQSFAPLALPMSKGATSQTTTPFTKQPLGVTPTPVSAPKSANAVNKSGGNMDLGQLGGWIGILGNVGTTILNRAGDSKNKNYFDRFGMKALDENQKAMGAAATTLDVTRDQNLLATSGQTAMNRNRTRSTGVQSALDAVALSGQRQANNAAQANYANTLAELFGQRAGLQNQADQQQMAGAERAGVADIQDRDAFFTNMSKGVSNTAEGLMNMQKMRLEGDAYNNWLAEQKKAKAISSLYSMLGI